MQSATSSLRRLSSLKVLWIFLFLFLLNGSSEALTAEDMMDISKKIVMPDPAVVQAVLSEKTDAALGVYYEENESERLSKGTSNTFYRNAFDIPLTRFVLGTLEVNFGAMEQVYNHIMSKLPATSGGPSGSGGGSVAAKLDLKDAHNAVSGGQTRLMRTRRMIPMFMLFAAIMIQFVIYVAQPLLSGKSLDQMSILSVLGRSFIFFMVLVFFDQMIAFVLTGFNFVTHEVLPGELQERLMYTLTVRTASLVDDPFTGFMNIIALICRWLGIVALKILLILRDVFLCLTVIIGPFVVALGFISTYGGPNDIFRNMLQDWVRGFMNLCFWGPYAAIVICCMGMMSVMTQMGVVNLATMAIFSLAALFAAKDVPRMAEEMSGIAFMSLATFLAPVGIKLMGMGTRGAVMMPVAGAVGAGRMIKGMLKGEAGSAVLSDGSMAASGGGEGSGMSEGLSSGETSQDMAQMTDAEGKGNAGTETGNTRTGNVRSTSESVPAATSHDSTSIDGTVTEQAALASTASAIDAGSSTPSSACMKALAFLSSQSSRLGRMSGGAFNATVSQSASDSQEGLRSGVSQAGSSGQPSGSGNTASSDGNSPDRVVIERNGKPVEIVEKERTSEKIRRKEQDRSEEFVSTEGYSNEEQVAGRRSGRGSSAVPKTERIVSSDGGGQTAPFEDLFNGTFNRNTTLSRMEPSSRESLEQIHGTRQKEMTTIIEGVMRTVTEGPKQNKVISGFVNHVHLGKGLDQALENAFTEAEMEARNIR